jgi:hypothetical protein
MNENNYGFVFNDITIKGNVLNKKAKNSLGKIKINNEIFFYMYIFNNNIDFPMPKLLNHEDGNLSIQYIKDSSTMTNIINSSNVNEYIDKIKNLLNNIHSIQKPVTLEIIKKDLFIELNKKIIDRFNEYDWHSNSSYNSINSVNNVEIKSIFYYCEKIQNKLLDYLKNRSQYNLIHGDVHLGNILIDNNEEIYFIDPRGYFGDSKLFGLYEYDYAKLLFGLSGYSVFDNMDICELNIINSNIDIEFIKKYEFIFDKNDVFDSVTILLSLSIWLGNNSCFSNINKKITSLMIALYFCEKYIDIC